MHVNAMAIPINPMRSTILRAVQRTSALFTLTTPRISFSPSSTLIINITKNNNVTAHWTTIRSLSTTPQYFKQKKQKLAHNNEPIPDSPPTTDFSEMDMLGQTPIPSTAIDECFHDGFALNSGVQISGGSGVLLVGGEAFEWRPWLVVSGQAEVGDEAGGEQKGKEMKRKLINEKGQWVLEREEQWGFLGRLWPRPDLLILGVGPSLRPISPATRALINSMGIRVEVLDTRNAASQYNLLATERGVDQVAAALVPLGWRE
ncbi:hypothetical protein SMACR_02132 [Sordaria macrospora]|uniref:WGS project CABT00000000 data, contig 2.18 n=2 Tax=Sordaria macrospora TaxID=5147 RepID=F7W123_SORMK|nr:uncharacterized protein SMAC_02132 [Sordaria macrospora k-hell]KAA8633285.1 hypothetical protein SMACR_02132 [Sordaria macrospora]KAH7629170.1 hypothetical protein B0T09DRAFT_152361 [Sordaria sp. MPI-SDFR-AT-0083]WPJ63780.1 hypothetical protein SMAC4_02132 [Sordaria macrospora]CCC11475.1 unnamed protein product [Sordaria macrospora k-hell]